ncbi:hypothetical protein [Acaryochloris marina]|uniref:hypothetical protein n=1 Tax=Acaryochloris marina TaxID=155978 RepID=UPI0005A1594D|nr:hypothetical protein [Acaryochloris marina]
MTNFPEPEITTLPELLGGQIYCSQVELQQLIGIPAPTLYVQTQAGKWVQGVHFVRLGRKKLWCLPLVLDRLHHWEDEVTHQRAIKNFFDRLPSGWSLLKQG